MSCKHAADLYTANCVHPQYNDKSNTTQFDLHLPPINVTLQMYIIYICVDINLQLYIYIYITCVYLYVHTALHISCADLVSLPISLTDGLLPLIFHSSFGRGNDHRLFSSVTQTVRVFFPSDGKLKRLAVERAEGRRPDPKLSAV